jgi:hypothetical protein
MVIRKVIGMIFIWSILLGENYIMAAPRQKKEPRSEQIKREIRLKRKANEEESEKANEEESKEESEEEKASEEESKEESEEENKKERNPLNEREMMFALIKEQRKERKVFEKILKKQVKVFREIKVMNQGGQRETQPQEKAGRSFPFTSVDEVKKYIMQIRESGSDARKNLRERIDATIRHFQSVEWQGMSQNIQEEQWRKTKIIEILHTIKKSFPERAPISIYCEDKIQEVCLEGLDGSMKNFEYMKLLLMAQCVMWNESTSEYRLSPVAQNSIVQEVVEVLKEMESDGSPAVSEKVKSLLSDIRRDRTFVKFFPPDY